MIQRFLIPLFMFIWWNRLEYKQPLNYFSVEQISRRGQVVKVKGWRTAIIDGAGGRSTVTLCLKR